MSMSQTALFLSIKPPYADAIFGGTKTIELRRVKPRVSAGDLVMVYVSSPRCRLEGAFEVAEVVEASPAELWRLFSKDAGISRADYDAYFQGRNKGYGIRIRKVWRLSPVSLKMLRASKLRPPQSYHYIRKDHPAFAKGGRWISKTPKQPRAS